jgi:Outer membrane protein beta-barrel domain
MKTRIALAFGIASSLIASSAFAEDIVGSTGVEKKLRLGAQVDVLPGGTLDAKAQNFDKSFDLTTAYGIGLNFDYDVLPWLSVGLAPRYILNILPEDAGKDDKAIEQWDLRGRVTAHFPVIDKLQAYGFAAPGYSIIHDPNENDPEAPDDPSGFVVAFGGGATYDITPSIYLAGEVGYQLGFQSTSIKNPLNGSSIDMDVTTNFLHIGLGAGARF